MSDPWINRLVVSGPTAAVTVFQTTVVGKSDGDDTSLSFVKLQSQLSAGDRVDLDDPVEPWDDASDAQSVGAPELHARKQPGMANLVYRFLLDDYEPDTMLIRASRLFPRLCFVLGWVAANVEEQASIFIHAGDSQVYHLPPSRKESIFTESYRSHGLSVDNPDGEGPNAEGPAGEDPDADDDESFWASTEADWAMLDAVVKHWDRRVARTLRGESGGGGR